MKRLWLLIFVFSVFSSQAKLYYAESKRTHSIYFVEIDSLKAIVDVFKEGYRDDYSDWFFESMKKISFDLWVASHAGQFNMHSKRKPGDGYHPEAFSSRTDFDDLLQRIEKEYQKRLKSEQSRWIWC